MGYVGTAPLSGDYRKIDDISGSFNGSTTAFTLQVGSVNVTPPKETTMLISVGGVLQEPISAYTISGSTLTFTSAPASGADFFGILLGDTMDIGTPSDATITAAKVENTFISGQTEITSGLAAADELLYSDGGTIKKVGLDNFVELAPTLATEDSIANGDYILFLDGGASGNMNKEAVHDLATLFAGTGLGASSSVISVDAAQTGITSLLATDIKIGEDDQTKIDFETADEIHLYAANVEQVYVADNIFGPQSDSDVDLGTTGVRWKDAYIDTITTTGAITASGIVTGTGFTAGSAVLAEAELELLDGLTAGTAIASKVVTTDANIDTTGQRNLTITGELDAASLDIEGDADINGTLETDAFTIGGAAVLAQATTSAVGAVELATSAEINTSTDAARAMTPDLFAASNYGIRYVQIMAVAKATDLTVADGLAYFHVPAGLDGMDLVEVHAEVFTAPAGSTATFEISNNGASTQMLSTNITIDAGETGSDSAATAAVIDASNDDLDTNDLIQINCTQIGSSTAGAGLMVTMGFRIP